MQACARAFAARIAGEPAAVPRYKLDYTDSRSTGSIADYFPTGSIFDLEARDPKTGAVLARARCSTDTRGAVIALSLQPLGDKNVTFADRM